MQRHAVVKSKYKDKEAMNMNIADKIIMLRKRRGLSQEELADMLDVTRQSVSKWESAQSVPDIQKILQLADIFGVTTDYLLKDDEEVSTESVKPVTEKIKTLSREQTEEVMTKAKSNAVRYAVATALCILSPLLLIVLNISPAIDSLGVALTEIIGLCVLFVLIAIGAGIFIYSYLKNGSGKNFDTDAAVTGEVRAQLEDSRKQFVPLFAAMVITGVTLCLISTIPLIVCAMMYAEYLYIGFIVFDIVITVAVVLFVWSGTKWYAYNRLLGLGEYSKEGRRKARIAEVVSGIYWPLIVAIYLATSFITNEWGKTWIIWPVAAVVFVVVEAVAEAIFGKAKSEDDKD